MSQAGAEVEALEFTLVKSDKAHDEAPEVSEEKFSRHISANQDFSFELHREVAPDQSNVMLSAWSVRQAFAMVLPDANEEGQSAIAETLGFSEEVDTALRSINLLNDELSARPIEGDEDRAPVFSCYLIMIQLEKHPAPFVSGITTLLSGWALFLLFKKSSPMPERAESHSSHSEADHS